MRSVRGPFLVISIALVLIGLAVTAWNSAVGLALLASGISMLTTLLMTERKDPLPGTFIHTGFRKDWDMKRTNQETGTRS